MTLTQLFTSIANALRSAKGITGTIKAENFPNEINGLNDTTDATATEGDVLEDKIAYADGQKLVGTYRWDNTTDYDNCLDKTNDILEDDTYDPIQLQEKSVTITQNGTQTILPDTGYDGMSSVNLIVNAKTPLITGTHFAGSTFSNADFLQYLDTSSMTSGQEMFSSCINLTTIPLIDTSNMTNTSNMFNYCLALTSIPLLDTSNVTNISYMFSRCGNLTTVPQLNTSKVTNFSSTFQNCGSLSNESLNNILAMCINFITTPSGKKLSNLGITSAQATICQSLSNWDAFVAAGWTTGY